MKRDNSRLKLNNSVNLTSLIKGGYKSCISKYFRSKFPIFLIFELTYRCNLRCLYCDRWDGSGYKEVNTETICRIISEGKALGLLRAYFSGGEALLRADLYEIMRFCRNLGIMNELWTNGTLLPDQVDILEQTDSLTLSLDGSEAAHDAVRGTGSYASSIRAAELARKAGVTVSFNFTLTSYNTDDFRDAVDVASSLKATLGFQPVSYVVGCSKGIEKLSPSINDFYNVLNQAIIFKKKYPHLIENSLSQLFFLKSWPELKPWNCSHGRMIFTVLPDGCLTVCTNASRSACSVSLRHSTLKEAIANLHKFRCGGCACYGAYDSSGCNSILPVSWEVFNFHVLKKWKN